VKRLRWLVTFLDVFTYHVWRRDYQYSPRGPMSVSLAAEIARIVANAEAEGLEAGNG
jgi:hypothetical protein